MELPKLSGINDHFIYLVENKQTLSGPIYSLAPVELETLKIYRRIDLANGFIWPFLVTGRKSDLNPS